MTAARRVQSCETAAGSGTRGLVSRFDVWMLRERIGGDQRRKHVPTPDNPDEFYLLLALVTALLPLQWHLGRKLHRKSSARTSLFHCVFAISNARFHQIKENETDEFRAALKAYKRTRPSSAPTS